MSEPIHYLINEPVSTQQYIDLLQKTSLGPRRSIQNADLITGMLQHSNLVISAWYKQELVGIARSVTDFYFCCYLADLAVTVRFQKEGIGKKLIEITEQQLQPECTLTLLAAPQAVTYYPKIGFSQHPSAWVKKPSI